MAAWLGLEANGSTGALGPAVAVSVALHVAVLAGAPNLATYADDAPRAPLNARLTPQTPPEAEMPAAVTAPVPQAEERPAAKPPAQPRAERRAAPPPRPAPSAAPAPVPVRPVMPEQTAAAAAPDAPALVLAARAESPSAAGGEPSIAPRAGPADTVDPGSLGQYRLALLGAARRHKLYPEIARERGWEGRVAVELVIAADGSLASASVKQSSGHGPLDREALEMLKRAAGMTTVPPALKGREFRLDVPVLFELRNG